MPFFNVDALLARAQTFAARIRGMTIPRQHTLPFVQTMEDALLPHPEGIPFNELYTIEPTEGEPVREVLSYLARTLPLALPFLYFEVRKMRESTYARTVLWDAYEHTHTPHVYVSSVSQILETALAHVGENNDDGHIAIGVYFCAFIDREFADEVTVSGSYTEGAILLEQQ
jgi:hypothetical protein